MAIHNSVPSMLKESLPEMLLVAKYCIEFKKESPPWPAQGCYGYPAALVLLCIADSIGSYVKKGNVKNHFKIFNNKDYYSLELDSLSLKVLYDYYRNTLVHNAVLAPEIILDIGQSGEDVIQKINGNYLLKLLPLYEVSVIAVNKLFNDPKTLTNNTTIDNINKKII